MIRKIVIALALTLSSSSFAGYNANLSGKIVNVLTYPNGLVLIHLDNQPTTHPVCTPTYFAIGTDVPSQGANRMLSRLLTAYTTKEVIKIGYDSAGGCADTYIRIHRIG